MSKLAKIKEIVIFELDDGKEHTSEELREQITENGINIDSKNSAFRTAIYQLRNSGINIESRERGYYRLVKEDKKPEILSGFTVLAPQEKVSKYFVYIHSDGKIILNGKLNGQIKSRNIEIRVSADCEKMALIINGENCHRFTKSGHTVNKDFLRKIGRKKINFPIAYEMEESDKENIWIGQLHRIEKAKKNIIK